MKPAAVSALLVLLLSAAVSATAQEASGSSSSRADAYWYGRFGYGTIGGDGQYTGLSFGFGRRIECDAFGLDLLLASGQVKTFGTAPDLHTIGGIYTHGYAASLLTVRGLYYLRPASPATLYVGAGAGWSAVSFGRTGDVYEDWHGHGPGAAFVVGYALARAEASTRLFVEAELTRPFGKVRQFSRSGEVLGHRRAPVLIVSLGAGW